MSNLEELALFFACYRQKSFVDGNDMRRNFLDHLPRLNKFAFNICSIISPFNQNDLRTNEDIQYPLKKFTNKKIISCVDYFPVKNEGQCHVYSYPFRMTNYERITNHFPGGFFPYVQKVSLLDERPFEHEFFLQIQNSFPLMKDLTVINWTPQHNKQSNKSKTANEHFSIIQYRHLTCLDLTEVHYHYIEQFLLYTKISLRNNLTLFVRYSPLRRATHNFQREATRINCSKIDYECIDNISPFPEHLQNYFLTVNP